MRSRNARPMCRDCTALICSSAPVHRLLLINSRVRDMPVLDNRKTDVDSPRPQRRLSYFPRHEATLIGMGRVP